MNVEIGTEAAPFPEKEYISGIFLAVYLVLLSLLVEFIFFLFRCRPLFQTYDFSKTFVFKAVSRFTHLNISVYHCSDSVNNSK